jgi:hypothetical protein
LQQKLIQTDHRTAIDRVHQTLALRRQHMHLSQLRDNLFRLVTLSRVKLVFSSIAELQAESNPACASTGHGRPRPESK